MNKITKIILIIVAIIIVVGLVWLSNKKPAEKGTIKIGAILPLSGQLSYVGQYMRQGIDLAVEEINKSGKLQKKIEVLYEDGQADVAISVSAYRNLADTKGVKFFLTTTSGVTLGLAPIAEKEKNILINIGSVSDKISLAGDYIFRHSVLPVDEMSTLAKFIYSHNYHKIGIIFVNAEAGISYKNLFKKEFEALGGQIINEESHEKGSLDYRTQILKFKLDNPDAIFIASYQNEIGSILKQSKELGLEKQWFAISDSEGPKLLEIAQNAAEGLIYTHYFALSGDSGLMKEYIEHFQQKFNEPPTAYSILAYDTINLIVQGLKHCSNNTSSECLKDGLYDIKNYEGASGTISFNSDGDTVKGLLIKTVKNGQFVPYEE